MTQLLVLTVMAPDRPGLVESLSEVVNRHNGNWLDSRMAHLSGRFAGILHVAVPDAQVESMRAELAQLATSGLHVQVETGTQPAAASSSKRRQMRLELTGQDRPGIVHDVAAALARHDANVEQLATGTQPAPMTGDLMFFAEADVSLGVDVDLAALRTTLEQVAGHLMVEINIEESME